MDPLHLSNQTAIQVLGLECQLRTAILTLKGTHTLLDLHPQLLSPSAVGHPPDIVSHLPAVCFGEEQEYGTELDTLKTLCASNHDSETISLTSRLV
jgi:hypothetical protein